MSDIGGHWQGMNKAPKEGEIVLENPYISGTKPPSFLLPEGVSIEGYVGAQLPKKVRSEICSFICQHNSMATGNVTLLDLEMVERLANTGAYCAILRVREGDQSSIVGSIFTIPVELNYRVAIVPPTPDKGFEVLKEGDLSAGLRVHSCYTSYLCLREDLRAKGLAMALIRKIMSIGWKYGVRSGYYMSVKTHHRCHIRLPFWYRLLDLEEAKKSGFKLPPFDAPGVRDKQRLLRMHFHIANPEGYSTEPIEDLREVEELRSQWEKDLKVSLAFEGTAMEKLTSNFSFHWILKSGVREAFFMLAPLRAQMRGAKQNAKSLQLSYFCSRPEAEITPLLKVVAKRALDLGASVFYGYCMGSLSSIERYRDFRVLECGGVENHIEFYNTDLQLQTCQLNLLMV